MTTTNRPGHVRRIAIALMDRDDTLSHEVAILAADILDAQGVSATNLRHEGRLTADLRINAVAAVNRKLAAAMDAEVTY